MYDIVGECLASSQQCSEAGWTSRGTGHVDQPRHGSQQIERCGRQEMLKMRPSETDVACAAHLASAYTLRQGPLNTCPLPIPLPKLRGLLALTRRVQRQALRLRQQFHRA